jgi:hypothetical protein
LLAFKVIFGCLQPSKLLEAHSSFPC